MAKDDIDLEFEDDFEDLDDFEDFDFDDLDSDPVESIPTVDPKTGKKRSPVEMSVLKTYTAAKEELKDKTFKDFASAAIDKSLSPEGKNNLANISNNITEIIDATKEELKPLNRNIAYLAKFGAGKLPDGNYFQKLLSKVSDKLTEENYESTSSIKETLHNFSNDIEEGFKSIEDNIKTSDNMLETNIQNLNINADILKILGTSTNIHNIIKEQNKLYYHKSLQLQWRMAHGIEEALDTSRKQFESQSKQLEAIIKNTSLPEAVKIQNNELVSQTFKTQSLGRITESLYKQGSFLNKLKSKVLYSVKDQIATASDITGGLKDMAESIGDAKEMGLTGEKFVGSSIANMLVGFGGKQLSKLIPRALKDNLEYDLASIANNPLEYLKNKRIENPEGLLGKLTNKLIDFTTGDELRQEKNKIELHSTGLESQAIFDGRTHSTINVVIPKLLSKIHNEIYGIRTNSKVTEDDELRYDLGTGKFISTREAKSNLRADINKVAKDATSRNVKYLKQHIESILEEVNTPNKDKVLKALDNALLGYIVNNGAIIPESLLSQDFLAYIPGELQLEAATLFTEFIKLLKQGKNPTTTIQYFDYASSAPKVPTALLQSNLGSNIDLLQDMNLVNVNRITNKAIANEKELRSVMTGNLERYDVNSRLIKNSYDEPIYFKDDLNYDIERGKELITEYIKNFSNKDKPSELEGEASSDGIRRYTSQYGIDVENSYKRLTPYEQRLKDNEYELEFEIEKLNNDEELIALKKSDPIRYQYEYNRRVTALKRRYGEEWDDRVIRNIGSAFNYIRGLSAKLKPEETPNVEQANIPTRNLIDPNNTQVTPRFKFTVPDTNNVSKITTGISNFIKTTNTPIDLQPIANIIPNNIKSIIADTTKSVQTGIVEGIKEIKENLPTSKEEIKSIIEDTKNIIEDKKQDLLTNIPENSVVSNVINSIPKSKEEIKSVVNETKKVVEDKTTPYVDKLISTTEDLLDNIPKDSIIDTIKSTSLSDVKDKINNNIVKPIETKLEPVVKDTKDIIADSIKKVEEVSKPVQEQIEATTERIATSVYDKILNVHEETVRAGILQENDIALESLEERKLREEKEKTTIESIKETVEEVKEIKEQVLDNLKEQTKEIKEKVTDSTRIQNLKDTVKDSIDDAKETLKDKAKSKLDQAGDFISKNKDAFKDPVTLIKTFGPTVALGILKAPYKYWNSGFAKKMRAKERELYGKIFGKITPKFVKDGYAKAKEAGNKAKEVGKGLLTSGKELATKGLLSAGVGLASLYGGTVPHIEDRKNSWKNRLDEMDKKKKEEKSKDDKKEKKTLWDRIKGLFKPAMMLLPVISTGIGKVVSGITTVGKYLWQGIKFLKPIGELLGKGFSALIKLFGGKGLGKVAGSALGTAATTAVAGTAAKKMLGEAGGQIAKTATVAVGEKAAITATGAIATQATGTVAKTASKTATKLTEKGIAKQIVKILESFKSKAVQKLGPKAGRILSTRIGMLIGKRLVPVLGWSLLLWDAGWIIKYMTADGLDLKSAVSKQILGFDLFSDDEPAIDEDGNPIKPDEQETSADKEYKKTTEEEPKDDKKKEEDSGFKWYNPSTWFGNNAKKEEKKVEADNKPVHSSQPQGIRETIMQMIQGVLSSFKPANNIKYNGNINNPDLQLAMATKGKIPPPVKIDSEFKKKLLVELNKETKRLNMSRAEKAAFLATVDVETGSLRTMTENLNYKKERLKKVFPKYFKNMSDAELDVYAGNPMALGNKVYSGRMGNGPENSGEGFKYRGRGLIQLTGKDNYTKFSKDTGIDVVNNPDLISSDPAVAARTATWYWETRAGLREAGQRGDTEKVRRLVNGGLNGYGHFLDYYNKYINGNGPLSDALNQIHKEENDKYFMEAAMGDNIIVNDSTTDNKANTNSSVDNKTNKTTVDQAAMDFIKGNTVQPTTPTVDKTPVAPVAPMGSVKVDTSTKTTDKTQQDLDLSPVTSAIAKSDTTQKQQVSLQEEMVNLLKRINEQLNISNQPEDDKAATRIQNLKKENQDYKGTTKQDIKNGESPNTVRPDRNRPDPVFSVESKVVGWND